MFEAKLEQAEILKKVLDAVKELVTDANFDCSDEGIKLQAMDNSHVALVSLNLAKSGFSKYRCDRDMSLGMSLASLTKIIKCAGNNDTVTLRADESHDALGLLFEAKKADRVGEYEMKLMDIDQEHLGIPDTVYDAEISLPAQEFARIIRDLKELGESVKIEVSKEGVRFSADGDIGTAAVTLKPTERRGGDDSDDEEGSDEEEEEEEEEQEEEEAEPKEEDEDVVIEDAEEDKKPDVNGDGDEEEGTPKKAKKSASESPVKKRKQAVDDDEEEEDEEEEPVKKKVKKDKGAKKEVKKEKKKLPKAPKAKKEKKETKKKGKKSDEDKDNLEVKINLQQSVALTFSIKYLQNFAKSTPLSDFVHLHMSNEVPLLVEYPFNQGHIRYYLAPKIADE